MTVSQMSAGGALATPASTAQRVYSMAYLTSCHCSVPEALRVAAAAGYAHVGLRLLPNGPGGPFQPLIGEPSVLREAQAVQRDTGVGVFDLEIIRIAEGFNPEAYRPLLEAGAALRAQAVLVAGDDPDEIRLSDGYARLCELMQPYGMTADLEFMPWTAVPNVAAALRVLHRAGGPANAGILVDALHWGRCDSTLEDVRAIPREWLHYAQICDAEAGTHFSTEQMIHTARCARGFPGEGSIDVQGLLSALPSDLPVSVEVVHLERMAQTTALDWAVRALAASRPFLER